MDTNRFTCSICYHFAASDMTAVLRHIGSIHAHQAGFRVVCGIGGCPRSYRNYGSFRKHLYRKHSEPPDTPASTDANFTPDVSSEFPNPVVFDRNDELKRSLIMFILKNKEVHNFSQFALNDLLSDISLILQDSRLSRIALTLSSSGISYEDVHGLKEVLTDEQGWDIFKGYHTTFLQRKLFASVGLVVSIIN
jgi:hypothetical protein